MGDKGSRPASLRPCNTGGSTGAFPDYIGKACSQLRFPGF